eukprot:TRINITY_DN33427_c0_g1_i1.p1 TRINITY_DN33427_c0_g1~~TRINITY_DN33427_c0_g1_i1.p1  ORF type:complete len:281 (+),score=29.79 TRINITY_DN33427_c0_g1_i1:66-908(+)
MSFSLLLACLFIGQSEGGSPASTCNKSQELDTESLLQLQAVREDWQSLPWEMCWLPCESGSCNNWLVNAPSLDECNKKSQAQGCGDCKASLDANLAKYVQAFGSGIGGQFVSMCDPKTVKKDDLKDTASAIQFLPCAFYDSCQLGCDSGACTNYLVATDNLEDCNLISESMGCGDCKASIPSEMQSSATLAGAGFATYCPNKDTPNFQHCGDSSKPGYYCLTYNHAWRQLCQPGAQPGPCYGTKDDSVIAIDYVEGKDETPCCPGVTRQHQQYSYNFRCV